MDPLLAALAERFGLARDACRRMEQLARFLIESRDAPTAIRGLEEIMRDHIADSIIGLQAPGLAEARRIADLGSGAGFPGLVLAAALPAAEVSLVESSSRKCVFLRQAVNAAEIRNAHVVNRRAEEWAEGIEACDAVIARALARLDVVAEYAAPLLCRGGVLVVWRGRRDAAEEGAARLASTVLGLTPDPPIVVTPYPAAMNRHLHVFRKTSGTPPKFPRRSGMARKYPLGQDAGSRADPGTTRAA
jgi:16S rRNA (guanine527-N7)-methyltransferase